VSNGRAQGWPLWLVLPLLLLLHFYVRPRFYSGRGAPDFLLLALLIVALETRPGPAAVAGFAVGLVTDVLAPVRVGAGALAHTVVAYLAAWGRSVFFPDNVLVNMVVFGACTWLRNLILLFASDPGLGALVGSLAPWGLLQVATTAVAGGVVTLALRHRVDVRLEE
jgi:rod shape-determining protein MreD